MKQIDKFCCCIFSLFLMVACQEEEIMDKTAGFQVSLQDMGVAIETKSTPAELGKPLADQFKLKVVIPLRCLMVIIPARRYLLRPVLIRYLLPMEIIRF